MNPDPTALFIAQGLTVITLVMAIRKYAPKIDGTIVLAAAAVVTPALVFSIHALAEGFPGWQKFAAECILTWGGAIGATTLQDRSGKNATDAAVAVVTAPTEPARVLVAPPSTGASDKAVVKIVDPS